jgi:hypothetical protein
MLDLVLDWRCAARWGAHILPLAGDPTPARPVRYVLNFRCPGCGACFMAAAPINVAQLCPDCGRELQRLSNHAWDLVRQAVPPWWTPERRR